MLAHRKSSKLNQKLIKSECVAKIDSEVDKNKYNIHYYRASVKWAKLSLSHISQCRDSSRLCDCITACFSHHSCSCYWYTQNTHCSECSNLLCSSDQHLSVLFNCLTFSPYNNNESSWVLSKESMSMDVSLLTGDVWKRGERSRVEGNHTADI